MFNIIIFGAPGSGKGTQSERMIQQYGLDYISTGNELRQAIDAGSSLGLQAKTYIDQGKLVPDELIIRLIADFLSGKPDSKGVIFDGFPRTIPQALALKGLLNESGTDVALLINLQVDEDELVNRLLTRGKNSGRSDDNPDTIQKRLDVYHTQTAPLITYYIGEGKCVTIKGVGSVDEIFQRIDRAVDKLLNP